ncbi:DNA repair protein RadA [Candidatus Parcubacteria bacterium]|nr:DNA repair protein RadA [Candidatus Parcubacteria bacterium]
MLRNIFDFATIWATIMVLAIAGVLAQLLISRRAFRRDMQCHTCGGWDTFEEEVTKTQVSAKSFWGVIFNARKRMTMRTRWCTVCHVSITATAEATPGFYGYTPNRSL